jgi:hypothetical protein
MLAHLCTFIAKQDNTLDLSKKNLGLKDNNELIKSSEISNVLTESLCKLIKKEETNFKYNYTGNNEIEVTSAKNEEETFTVIYKFEDILTRIPLCKKFQSITTVDGKSKLWETGTNIPNFGQDVLKNEDFPIRSWEFASKKLKTPIADLQKYFTIEQCIINDAENGSGNIKINLAQSNELLIEAVKVAGGSDAMKDSNLSQINSQFFGHTTTYFRLTTIVKSGPKRSTIRVTCKCGNAKKNNSYTQSFSNSNYNNNSNDSSSALPFTIISTERF